MPALRKESRNVIKLDGSPKREQRKTCKISSKKNPFGVMTRLIGLVCSMKDKENNIIDLCGTFVTTKARDRPDKHPLIK